MPFTFLASAGSFIVETGIFYLTKHTYKFGDVENYALGLSLGVTYVAGALGAGPMLSVARRVVPALTSRWVLFGMMLVMAGLCAVPWLVLRQSTGHAAGEDAGSAVPAHWPIWVLVLVYSPLTGVLWPMVESYIAGGRSGANLRSTIGWWNVIWSSALVVASLWMARYVKDGAADLILALGGVHVLCAALVLAFGPEPLPHPHEATHLSPPQYRKLLMTFQLLLPMSYVVSSAMMPFLPSLMERLDVAVGAQTVLGGIWFLARSVCFVFMERSEKWHGRWWHPAAAMTTMLAGFALVALCEVLGNSMGGTHAGRIILGIGLAILGVGMASIYSGAIYYAMEVGQAKVDAGGTHEGLIGVGYSLGPGIGLLVSLAVWGGILREAWLEPTVLLAIAAMAIVVVVVVAGRIGKMGRAQSGPNPAG